jgi:DNA polymerase III epsilon subunit-like protein
MAAKKRPADKFDIFMFDTETTGLSQRAEIVQFAGILLDGDTLEEKDRIESLIAPSSPEHLNTADARQALAMNHLGARKQELLEAPTFFDFCQEWIEMKNRHRDKKWIPSGYNIGNFDLPKMRYRFWQIRGMMPTFTLEQFFHYHVLDCMPLYIAKNWYNGFSAYVSQKYALKHYGIENAKAHDAMADAEACAKLLRKILMEYK